MIRIKMQTLILLYIVLINIIAFVMIFIDKIKAKKGKYRISEKSLFVSGILGGIIGMILGIKFFRHKVRKSGFLFVTFLIFMLNLLYWYLFYRTFFE